MTVRACDKTKQYGAYLLDRDKYGDEQKLVIDGVHCLLKRGSMTRAWNGYVACDIECNTENLTPKITYSGYINGVYYIGFSHAYDEYYQPKFREHYSMNESVYVTYEDTVEKLKSLIKQIKL